MVKKTIKYTDYDGNVRTEDFYFNLSKAEFMEMELGTTGGFSSTLRRIVDAREMPAIIKIFKEFVLKAYGEKSPDGKRFVKSEELSTAFSQTEAYSELFMELATDAQKASNFMNSLVPKDMLDEMTKELEKEENKLVEASV